MKYKGICMTEPRCEICINGCYEDPETTFCLLCNTFEPNNHECSAFEPKCGRFEEDDE